MASERLSVIISTRPGVDSLERCLRALEQQRPGPDELIIVHDGSLDVANLPVGPPGCRVVQLEAPPGISAARNAGAYAAEGEILVFLDGDATVRPAWAQALRSAFADGASVAGGGIESSAPRSLSGSYVPRWSQHDQEGRNGFLPFVSGTHLAIRRDVFLRLGGFDEQTPLSEDVDLSLRAQLAGYPIVFVPEAELVHQSSPSVGGLLRQRLQRARADRMTERRFRRFPFMSLDSGGGVARAFTTSAAALLIAGKGEDPRSASRPLLDAGFAAAAWLGTRITDLDLRTGLVAVPPALAYRDPAQHNTSSPLPGPPAFLLLGDDRLVMTVLRLACEGGSGVILAPPGLEREAIARWDQPAPWSMRLVRTAVRAGWPLSLETAALRVEREQPRTWGEAFLTLHRVHAWARGRRQFGLAALGSVGYQLAQRLPGVPVVMAGQGDVSDDRSVLRVTRSALLRDRHAVGAELSGLIAAPSSRHARPLGREPAP
jgi:GT2 family glycosyltransferase